MRILVACEESQRVCKEFRKRGHEAYSCDIIEPSGGRPEWHIKDDCIPLLNGDCEFVTITGKKVYIQGQWDMIIAFPPCTYMTTASACRMYHRNNDGSSYIDEERVKSMILSRDLFMSIYNARCKKIVIENPTPMKIACLPPATQVIQPYQFGHPWTKRTLLWIRGVGKLVPTEQVEPYMGSWVNGCASAYKTKGKENIFGKSSSKERSETFPGIAKAMAEQWG